MAISNQNKKRLNLVSPAANDVGLGDIIQTVQALYKKKPIAVSTKNTAYHLGTTAAGTVAGTTFRHAHVMKTKSSFIQEVFGNFYPTVTSESSNTNPVLVACTIEYGGTFMRLSFNGSRVKQIDPGGIAVTDPVYKEIPIGATYYTRTWVGVATDGELYPHTLLLSGVGEGKGAGDATLAAGALTSAPTEFGYGPIATIGMPVEDKAIAFGVVGDSIAAFGDGESWIVELVKQKYGYIIMSKASSTAQTMITNTPNAYRLRMGPYITHAIVNYGTNDFDNPNPYETQVATIAGVWKALADMGIEVYQSTVLPRTTSTDAFATIGNQTVYNTNGYNDKRLKFNAELRAGKYPVKVIDIAANIESSQNSGKWKAGYTTDGIHPLASVNAAAIAGLTLDIN